MKHFLDFPCSPSVDFFGLAVCAVAEAGAVGLQKMDLGPKGEDAERPVWAPDKWKLPKVTNRE